MNRGIQTVIYKHILDRAPTLEDRARKIGMIEFAKKLEEHGWLDGEGLCTREFDVTYEGHGAPGDNYIQWTAILGKSGNPQTSRTN